MNDFTKSGEFIASLRKEKGLTQSELAALIGVGDKSVSKWERGINVPDVLVLQSLAKIFNVTVSEILNGERVKKLDPTVVRIYENKYVRYTVYSIITIFVIVFFGLLIYFCNNYDKSRVYSFKGRGDNYSIIGNIFMVGNEPKLIIDVLDVYDINKYEGLLTSEYRIDIYLGDDLIYFFTKTGMNDDGNDEKYAYEDIINAVSFDQLHLTGFNYKNIKGDGYMTIEFVCDGEKYTNSFNFYYTLESRNNKFFYK